MKKIWKTLEYNFDYYFVYFLYKTEKIDRYHDFMIKKWGNRYLKD